MPGSSDCSEAATEPHGYSAPMPIPRRKLREYSSGLRPRSKWGETHRHALNMASMPFTLWCAPLDAAESAEKRATMPVASIYTSCAGEAPSAIGGDRRGTHHSEFTAQLIRQIAKDEHTNDRAGESDTADRVAVVCGDLLRAIYTLEHCQRRR